MESKKKKIFLEESEILKLIWDYLNKKKLIKSLLIFEEETKLNYEELSKELQFLKQLILKGEFEEAENFLKIFQTKLSDNLNYVIFEIKKQRFLELIETKPNAELLIKILNELGELTSEENFKNLCYFLTLKKTQDHPGYKNWTIEFGRFNCFANIKPYLSFLQNEKNNKTKELNSLPSLLKKLVSYEIENDKSLQNKKISILQKDIIKEKIINTNYEITWKTEIDTKNLLTTSVDFGNKIGLRNLIDSNITNSLAQSVQIIGEENEAESPNFDFSKDNLEKQYILENVNSFENKIQVLEKSNINNAIKKSPKKPFLNINVNQSVPIREGPHSDKNFNKESLKFFNTFHAKNDFPQNMFFSNRLSKPKQNSENLKVKTENEEEIKIDKSKKLAFHTRCRSNEQIIFPQKNNNSSVIKSSNFIKDNPPNNLLFDNYVNSAGANFLKKNTFNENIGQDDVIDNVGEEHFEDVIMTTREDKNSNDEIPENEEEFQKKISTAKKIDFEEKSKEELENTIKYSETTQNIFEKRIENQEYNSEKVFEYDFTSMVEIAKITDSQPIRTACFSFDGEYFAIGTNSRSLKIFSLSNIIKNNVFVMDNENESNVEMIYEKKNHHQGSIYSLDWSLSGNFIASGSNDKTVKVIKLQNLSSDETQLVEKNFYGHSGIVRSVCFNLGETKLFSAGSDNLIKLWDIDSGKNYMNLIGHNNAIYCLRIGEDGKTLASCGQDKSIKIWDLNLNKAVVNIKTTNYAELNHISLSKGINNFALNDMIQNSSKLSQKPLLSNDSIAAASHSDGTVTFWDLKMQKLVNAIYLHDDDCRSVEYNSASNYICTASFDSSVVIYNLQKNEIEFKIKEHDDRVVLAKWHPFYPFILSTSADKTARLFSSSEFLKNL